MRTSLSSTTGILSSGLGTGGWKSRKTQCEMLLLMQCALRHVVAAHSEPGEEACMHTELPYGWHRAGGGCSCFLARGASLPATATQPLAYTQPLPREPPPVWPCVGHLCSLDHRTADSTTCLVFGLDGKKAKPLRACS